MCVKIPVPFFVPWNFGREGWSKYLRDATTQAHDLSSFRGEPPPETLGKRNTLTNDTKPICAKICQDKLSQRLGREAN